MPVEFFEKELFRVQERFNQTFGTMPTCNPTLRAKVVFAIVQMCILKNKIKEENRREDISKFVRTKSRLERIFEKLTTEKERKKHDAKSRVEKDRSHQKPVRFDNFIRRAN